MARGEFLHHHPRFDRLAQADIVSDEKSLLQSADDLMHRRDLVGLQLGARVREGDQAIVEYTRVALTRLPIASIIVQTHVSQGWCRLPQRIEDQPRAADDRIVGGEVSADVQLDVLHESASGEVRRTHDEQGLMAGEKQVRLGMEAVEP